MNRCWYAIKQTKPNIPQVFIRSLRLSIIVASDRILFLNISWWHKVSIEFMCFLKTLVQREHVWQLLSWPVLSLLFLMSLTPCCDCFRKEIYQLLGLVETLQVMCQLHKEKKKKKRQTKSENKIIQPLLLMTISLLLSRSACDTLRYGHGHWSHIITILRLD